MSIDDMLALDQIYKVGSFNYYTGVITDRLVKQESFRKLEITLKTLFFFCNWRVYIQTPCIMSKICFNDKSVLRKYFWPTSGSPLGHAISKKDFKAIVEAHFYPFNSFTKLLLHFFLKIFYLFVIYSST